MATSRSHTHLRPLSIRDQKRCQRAGDMAVVMTRAMARHASPLRWAVISDAGDGTAVRLYDAHDDTWHRTTSWCGPVFVSQDIAQAVCDAACMLSHGPQRSTLRVQPVVLAHSLVRANGSVCQAIIDERMLHQRWDPVTDEMALAIMRCDERKGAKKEHTMRTWTETTEAEVIRVEALKRRTDKKAAKKAAIHASKKARKPIRRATVPIIPVAEAAPFDAAVTQDAHVVVSTAEVAPSVVDETSA
jgi:hypothetical protein